MKYAVLETNQSHTLMRSYRPYLQYVGMDLISGGPEFH